MQHLGEPPPPQVRAAAVAYALHAAEPPVGASHVQRRARAQIADASRAWGISQPQARRRARQGVGWYVLLGTALLCLAYENSAHAVERTMAPRQLFTQPMEDDHDPEPGSKRVRPSSADEGSMQVRLRARASACGTPWPGPAPCALAGTPGTGLGQWPELAALGKGKVCCKHSFEYCSTPFYYHSFGCPLQTSSEAQLDLGAIRCIQMVISKKIGTSHA
eukprot:scaffold6531_cov125-Isochrysis_galbana.AAC.1